MRILLTVFGMWVLMMTSDDKASPPMAKVVPHELTAHGDTRVDNYYWLKDREDPEVSREEATRLFGEMKRGLGRPL